MTVEDRPVAVRTTRAAASFLSTESGSALLLLGATLIALIWVNLPFGDTYDHLWQTELELRVGNAMLAETLREWVNQGLMSLFFFLIGLEIARELSVGEYRDKRAVVVPAVAAVGGSAVPALIYLAITRGGDGANGWGIVMATDTAFALGVLALVGPRCPTPLRVFLLALAIVDDILAITVIAVFYTDSINLTALGAAVALFVVLVVMRRLGVGSAWLYAVVAVLLWLATFESGVHPTIAGVLTGLLFAAYVPDEGSLGRTREAGLAFIADPTAQRARTAIGAVGQTVSANDRLSLVLHPATSFVIVPVFALANAGVPLGPDALGQALASPITHAVVIGLLLGKLIGITGASWLALKIPGVTFISDVRWGQLAGTAAVGGIGFTISLFITELAFEDPVLRQDAKIGIVVASALAALLSYCIFRVLSARGGLCQTDGPLTLPSMADIPDPD